MATVRSAEAKITINEIDLASNKIEITNTGASSINMSTWWFCNRVNGAPFYSMATAYPVDAVLSSAGASLSSVDPGDILVLDLTPGLLPDLNGEFGIYNTNSFGSQTAIEDYILWGSNGIRDIVAENAGLWTDNDSIDISLIGAGETLQLIPGLPGNSASEYFIGSGSVGAVNVPEPATVFLLATGSLALLLAKRYR